VARKSKIGSTLPALLIIIVGIIFVIAILRNKNFLKFGSPVTVGAAIGDSVPGPNVYPVVGPIAPTAQSRVTVRSSGTSFRDNQLQ
jgi:hypothetical protein